MKAKEVQKDSTMIDEAKELQRTYVREWRRKNKDKVKQYNKNYWTKKAVIMTTDQKKAAQTGHLTEPVDN